MLSNTNTEVDADEDHGARNCQMWSWMCSYEPRMDELLIMRESIDAADEISSLIPGDIYGPNNPAVGYFRIRVHGRITNRRHQHRSRGNGVVPHCAGPDNQYQLDCPRASSWEPHHPLVQHHCFRTIRLSSRITYSKSHPTVVFVPRGVSAHTDVRGGLPFSGCSICKLVSSSTAFKRYTIVRISHRAWSCFFVRDHFLGGFVDRSRSG